MLCLLENWLKLLSCLIQYKSFDWQIPGVRSGRACLGLRKLVSLLSTLNEHLRAFISQQDVRFLELVFIIDLIHVDLQ